MSKKTPFDSVLEKLHNKITLKHKARRQRIHKKWRIAYAFAKVLKIRYLQMLQASEKYWHLHKESLAGKPPDLEALQDYNIAAKISYFDFIEELNRYGRFFEKTHRVPYFYRIRFYRNKIIEHWEDYREYLLSSDMLRYACDKLVIPYHGQTLQLSIQQKTYQKLKTEFKSKNVILPQKMPKYAADAKTSEMLFKCLEKIKDKKLNICRDKENPLINALFKFGFPTPIHDLEEYIKKLVKWFETL